MDHFKHISLSGEPDLLATSEGKRHLRSTLEALVALTPEELAMIPDGGTIESSKWKKRPRLPESDGG